MIIISPTDMGKKISLVTSKSRFFLARVPIATKVISTRVLSLALIGGKNTPIFAKLCKILDSTGILAF